MKQFFKILIYLLFVPIILWLAYVAFVFLVAFSYADNILSWIPYIILGGWVPGKWYGLTLLHSIFCVAISFGVIGLFDKKLEIANKARLVILILVSLLFLYEAIFNFFFQNGQQADIAQFRLMALLQFSFLIGILIKTFNLMQK
jgi:hypothetical protein